MAYSVLAEGRSEEELEKLDIELGMISSPEEEALAALRAHQEEMGMEFDDPEGYVPPDDKTLYDGEGDVPWR